MLKKTVACNLLVELVLEEKEEANYNRWIHMYQGRHTDFGVFFWGKDDALHKYLVL